ncbi:anti-sigma factor family protein [Dictyobacter kobayashii]|uniref:anti-sigma factor family protein n=1 Tax=Dictyobacter kobayashii TaxID=2014872 RepID=UPI000F82CED5|nr:zf-HC2 domain-containing protein [Dictyobacter kobayashii]
MNCEQVKDLLSAYLDDQLTAYERQSVAAHLPSCLQCNAILADYRRFDTLLSQVPRVSPPPDLRYRILATTGSFVDCGHVDYSSSYGYQLQCMPACFRSTKLFPRSQLRSSLRCPARDTQNHIHHLPLQFYSAVTQNVVFSTSNQHLC